MPLPPPPPSPTAESSSSNATTGAPPSAKGRPIATPAADDDAAEQQQQQPTRNQLWQWCLRADAVAQCFVRDVLALRSHDATVAKDQDAFWWLGTVPCRCVRTVGMVVGARAYERRTVYTLDDGTGVIQCVQLHPGGKPKSRKQAEPPPPMTSAAAAAPEAIPKPAYEVGDVLHVAGRVEAWHDSFQIVVNEIELCRANDEPDHWIATAKLHETYYTQPFVIPPLPQPPPPKTPVKPPTTAAEFATPHTVTTVATPSTATTSSPSVQADGPVLLRHPSRLHSRDLLSSTFKIYLKNYMDVLSDPLRHVPLGLSRRDSSADVAESWAKRRKHSHQGDDDEQSTPRPRDRRSSRQWLQEEDAATTPRPLSRGDKENTPRNGHPPQMKGFTLSYLRRVPELADLAFRVIDAEAKRRAREARRKEKDAVRAGKQRGAPPSEAPARGHHHHHPEPARRKAKRLFTWAIRELYKEGSIVLHDDDAPVWALRAAAHDTRGVWRPHRGADRSADVTPSDSSVLSAYSVRTHAAEEGGEGDEDRGELSDPPAHEESYIPLTPALLADPVIHAIRSMMRRPRPPPPPLPPPKSATTRTTAKQTGGAYRMDGRLVGPTAEELQAHMGKLDARWEHVTVYAVEDALELLKAEDRVYRIGKGRWEICL